jgi:hypothetical protein
VRYADPVAAPLRLLVFDRTCRGPRLLPGLSHAWSAGSHLYRGLGRLDAGFGADSWEQALEWLADHGGGAPIAEIQFWGHGNWGNVRLAGEVLDHAALAPGHHLQPALARVRARLLPGEQGLWWFRTCETFGTAAGHDFARAWTRWFGCRAAGHTHVIGFWQSGLHALLPGAEPHWPVDEGLRPGRAGVATALAAPSRPGAPNTITCLHGRVPEGF